MPKISKIITTALIILGMVAAVIIFKKYFFTSESLEIRLVKARSKGDAAAPIKIIEYIDLQCPACAYGAGILHKVMDKYPGQIHLEMYYFPLPMHKHTMTASYFAECAALQGDFWPFHDLILQEQDAWKMLEDVRPHFFGIAERCGIDKTKLDACLNDPAVAERILADKKAGESKGVKSTPTYFINGEMAVGGRGLTDKLTALLGSDIL